MYCLENTSEKDCEMCLQLAKWKDWMVPMIFVTIIEPKNLTIKTFIELLYLEY